MAQQYKRDFITLKCDRTGYGFKDKAPSGRCIIEQNGPDCKLAFTVQDLKPGVLYKAYAIRVKGGRAEGFPVGAINADDKGKGELRFHYSAKEAGKIAPADIDVAAVFVSGGKELGIVTPLVGYRGDMVHWKQGFVDMTTKPTATEVSEEARPEPPTEATETTVWEEAAEVPAETAAEEEKGKEAESEPVVMFFQVPEPEDFVADPVPVSESEGLSAGEASVKMEEAFFDMAQSFRKELEELNFYDLFGGKPVEPEADRPKPKNLASLMALFGEERQFMPFKRQNRPVEWVRIAMDDLELLPIDPWAYMSKPFVTLSFSRYQHLILGRLFEDGVWKFYVGVPARYEDALRQGVSRLGFQQFKCCDDVGSGGGHGYWLLKIAL